MGEESTSQLKSLDWQGKTAEVSDQVIMGRMSSQRNHDSVGPEISRCSRAVDDGI
ncbi:hypothetical protein AVEN_110306-1, partial [Araneus ventricosus]